MTSRYHFGNLLCSLMTGLTLAWHPPAFADEPTPATAPTPAATTSTPIAERPKQVFAHYMGCWPVASGSLLYERRTVQPKELKYLRGGDTRFGGHVRNFDLAPQDLTLTPIESADLEIRRALAIGIDGFAVDAWAGGDSAKATLDALFAAAEAKDYPFQITVCIDPMCGGDLVGTVKELLAKHGTSPKLARRDGKPLIFGYQSWCTGMGWIWSQPDKNLPEAEKKAVVDRLRTTPEGWKIMGETFPKAAEQIGQPIFFHYCMTWFFFNVDPKVMKETKPRLAAAAAVIAPYVGAVGGFVWLGNEQEAIAKVVKDAGTEWSAPVGHYQKENIPWEYYGPAGTEWMGSWDGADRSGATLLQLITWNDYGENTNIAPAYNTRYGLYDLTGYYITRWKTGKPPETDHDRVYLNYHKHTKAARIWPFKAKFGPQNHALEVITILPSPATIRLPGRNIEYEAPAGFHRAQFPLTVGPVSAEVVRDGKVTTLLESPEPITDRPFREDNGLVCISTEDARHWKNDFGPDTPMFLYNEYGDVDGDGMPNWFEMYFFGTFLDMSTAGIGDPAADPDHDGISNLDEYKAGTDPTAPKPETEPDAGPGLVPDAETNPLLDLGGLEEPK